MATNRRVAPRTPIVVDVNVDDIQSNSWVTRTKDVSDSGAFLLFARKQKIDQGSTVWLQVQNKSIQSRRVEAEVVRMDAIGVGVRFMS